MKKKKHLSVEVEHYNLILSPLLNKGTAFTEKERDTFKLHGLLPPYIGNLTHQKKRSYEVFKTKSTDQEKYIYLRDLQDSNETLFYSLIKDHVEELLPIIYTPTVGLGCQKFSKIFRRPRGVFISYPLRDRMDEILAHKRFDSVKVIVVSDGERILGLGDQGVGGMGIPIGKLALYSALAGIHPRSTLPIFLDVGTNNEELTADPLYLGWRSKRIQGRAYSNFIESFVASVKKRFPNILLQWEDFSKTNATEILENYQDKICSFNDDIQGTASIVVATLLAAIEVSKVPLSEHTLVIAGAGSAGCGIASLVIKLMEEAGISEEDALSRIFLTNQKGLLVETSTRLLPFQKRYCKSKAFLKAWSSSNKASFTLEETVKQAKPTILIGVTGQAKLFTKAMIQQMAKTAKHPIIFPLSNPTSCSEADPKDLIDWTKGKVLFGTGSPFEPVKRNGKFMRVDQANNAYIFPGVGLGVMASGAKRVTEEMFIEASKALAKLSPSRKDPEGNLLPPITDSSKISFKVALAVAKEAMRAKLATKRSDKKMEELIKEQVWDPVYLEYQKKRKP